MISIKTYHPETLKGIIKSFWCLIVAENIKDPYIEEIIPDLHHEIIFEINASSYRRHKNSWVKNPTIYFAGQNSHSYKQKFQSGAIIYGIRFYPHTQALLYDFEASLSTDYPIPFSDISSCNELCSCISESAEKTFHRFEKVLFKKISGIAHSGTFKYVDAAINKILKVNGAMKISSLEHYTGVSSRSLEKGFKHYVGIGPKQFSNMVRYNHFISIQKNQPEKPLTSIAYEADFYDQSHLIRQSRQISGKTPSDLLLQPGIINDHFISF
ncbi:DUF6597 domain-containing transcriptional factor [Ekhidna sp.]|uniref:DUF6597 domain-containing transcriptional factor n=1 Tax=Ekhidna sp. TaxID=2608089 RepID=UPI003B5AC928